MSAQKVTVEPIYVHACFGLVKMKRYQQSDEEIRDFLYQTATLIGEALRLVHNLADGFVSFPEKDSARTQLIDSCMQIQATLADQLDAMRKVLDNAACMGRPN